MTVDDDKLVFVELDFERNLWIQDCDTGTTVVGEQFFVIIEHAFEHGQIDMLAIQVGVTFALLGMTGFQDDIDFGAQRGEQIDEQIE